MTIRKSSTKNGGLPVIGVSYPLSPTSPSQHSLRNNGLGPSDTEISPWHSDRDAPSPEYKKEVAAGHDIPPSLKIGEDISKRDAAANPDTLPLELQVRPAEVTPRSSFESQQSKGSTSPSPAPNDVSGGRSARSKLASNNPFLRQMSNPVSVSTDPAGEQSSARIWADRPDDRLWYQQNEPSAIPQTLDQPTSSRLPQNDSQNATSHSAFPKTLSSLRPMKDVPFEDPWSDPTASPPLPTQTHPINSGVDAGRNNFAGSMDSNQHRQNYVDHGGPIFELPNSLETGSHLPQLPQRAPDDVTPGLPQRTTEQTEGHTPPQSARPELDTPFTAGAVDSRTQADLDKRKKQKSETYQIRLVNWYDASSNENPRRSPIMVQNANGPCPLLALVNALVLSTPSGLETALLDTLERREQVSLGLLLDAVIDELMSGRRGDAAQNLPDVSDLYAFLVNLHTGMNVNPIFVQNDSDATHLLDAPISAESVSVPILGIAGGFESTREMRLYSTFAVPLIHGWIPSNTHAACEALRRSAKTYEDAQNLMFAEEELEDKLFRQGLTQEEQRLLQDIASVKFFLSSSATQLTEHGLNQIMNSLRPGSIAILFRNDHFSTLYRHPSSGQLFTLVTDMGYAGHDEVVWESLVDISGEGSGFFAGDFRPVGNNNPNLDAVNADDDIGWTTVRGSNPNDRSRSYGGGPIDTVADLSSLRLEDSTSSHTSPKAEQEDHDLALALQLQEEEEERERQGIAARRRENELSQTYLGSQSGSRGHRAKWGSETRPAIPPRSGTSGRDRGQGLRGIRGRGTHPGAAVQPEDGDDAPPPTYDQAASGPAYNPPPSHPAHPNAFSTSATDATRPHGGPQGHSSAYPQNSSGRAESPTLSRTVNSSIAGSPSTIGSRGRRNAARASVPGRGLSAVEGAPGVYRQTEGKALDEGEPNRGCIVM